MAWLDDVLNSRRARNARIEARRRSRLRVENPVQVQIERARNANAQARRRQRMRTGNPTEWNAERARNTNSHARRRQHARLQEPHRLSARGCLNLPPALTLGAMRHKCIRCEALHFEQEQTSRQRHAYSTCCRKGKVRLAPVREMPLHLAILFPHMTNVDESVCAHHLLPPTLAHVPLHELRRDFMHAI